MLAVQVIQPTPESTIAASFQLKHLILVVYSRIPASGHRLLTVELAVRSISSMGAHLSNRSFHVFHNLPP